ncbi:MAG: hypothetical protein BWY90_00873 [Deltaproteobacteria bacterium ADurb.BinA014]|nr:MAG: hypothetical protein BWY90_00873 [Deltaproteobacteria bacterium ADurb.BinA014]
MMFVDLLSLNKKIKLIPAVRHDKYVLIKFFTHRHTPFSNQIIPETKNIHLPKIKKGGMTHS